jgi:hypothetical protein
MALSLRANGSAQSAADDRLREAIRQAARDRMDCFVALLLAMTTNTKRLHWLHFESDFDGVTH